MKHSEGIVAFFDEILNEKFCYELARKHNFIQRSTSKLKGYEFIKAMIIPSEGLSTDSLQGLCMRIREFNPDADLSAQALCERINKEGSKKLLKGVFATILHHARLKIVEKCPKLTPTLAYFKSTLVEDSTVAKLNEKLQDQFTGNGRGTKAQIKIDLIYNLASGILVDAEIHSGNEPDQGLASRITKYVEAGDLVLRDLGYFVLKSLKNIADLGAYYLSRFQPNVKVYLDKDDLHPMDIGKYIEKYHAHSNIVDIGQVFLGDEKIPTRLVAYRLPKDVVEKRSREANKRAKETGRQMSHGKILCLKYAIFVTNATESMLSAEIIGTVYRLRWEIELVFKRWKSQLRIDYLKGIDVNRIESLIWSRLTMVIIIEMVSCYISQLVEKMLDGREISHAKLIAYILRKSAFCIALMRNQLEEYLMEMEKNMRRMLLKDKRMRKTMRERVYECESYYEMRPSDIQKGA
jgi:DDE family transposase